MGDGMIYEDDNVRVRVVRPADFVSREGMNAIPVTAADLAMWTKDTDSHALNQEVAVTLSAHQWAGVLAMLRIATMMSDIPGVARLAHDDIYKQMPINPKPRQDADGSTEGENR
jgi:hypothetical protein